MKQKLKVTAVLCDRAGSSVFFLLQSMKAAGSLCLQSRWMRSSLR